MGIVVELDSGHWVRPPNIDLARLGNDVQCRDQKTSPVGALLWLAGFIEFLLVFLRCYTRSYQPEQGGLPSPARLTP